jgi:ABC-type nitrate/sulfonate/bicarbonate transport system ATPase subunit
MPMGTAKLVVHQVSHSFTRRGEEPVEVLRDVCIEVQERRFITIVGPSGCGKSTLFNVIAGLVEPISGQVLVDGKPIHGDNPHIAYMLQKDLLLDWRNVLDNIIIGAEMLGTSKKEARQEAMRWVDQFGLRGFEKKYPFALSGGMRQRVALLRTLLTHRQVMLLDEPFGSLDAQTRVMMQEFVMGLWGSLDRTILFITHDVEESIILGDEIYVMTARPMQVKTRIHVNLPRPRSYDVTLSPEFFKLKAQVMNMIHKESVRALADEEGRVLLKS